MKVLKFSTLARVDFPTPLDAIEADFASVLLFSSLVRTFVPGLERPTVQIGRRDDEFRVIEIRILATRVENQRTGRIPGGGPLGAPGGCSRAAFWLGCAPGVCRSPPEPANCKLRGLGAPTRSEH